MFECVILNGLTELCFDDGCTFVSKSGASTVDYFIMSYELLASTKLASLNIDNRIDSDHLPVALEVRLPYCSGKQNDQSDDCDTRFEKQSFTEKIMWDKEKENEFCSNFNSPDAKEILTSADKELSEGNIEKALNRFVDCLLMASSCMKKKIPTKKKSRKNLWFDEECREAKRNTRKKLKTFRQSRTENDRVSYTDTRKVYLNLIRKKKNDFNRSKAESLASNLKNPSAFWKELNGLIGGKKSEISDKIDMHDWYEHFKGIFSDTGISGETSTDYPEDESVELSSTLDQKISEDEVAKSIRNLKSGKACGLDGILADMLKAGGREVIVFLTKLFNCIFDLGYYPEEWAKAIIIPIYKKGNTDLVDNYRGVSLLSIVSKCYTSILNQRLYNWLEDNEKIVEAQAGFRKNHSTTDHIFTLYAIAQKCLSKKGKKLYVAFVDFKKAFDSVRHNKLLDAIYKEGVKGKLFCALKSMYDRLLSCVRVNGCCSDFFDCPKGVRQGCVLSPTLFSLFINQLAMHISETGKHGVQLLPGLMELFILLFADDVTLIATSPFGLQNQLNCLKKCCDNLKMEVNKDKTKVMVFRKGGHLSKSEKWQFDGHNLEVVNEYCYLGFRFTTKLSLKQGTQHLVSKAKKAVAQLSRTFNKLKGMSKDIFFTIFDSKVQSILLYSSEIWGYSRLDSIEKVHLLACKRFLGVPLRSPNNMVYGELGRYPLYVNSYVRCLRYWFRVLGMEENRLPKQAYQMLVKLDHDGTQCWASEVRKILSNTGFSFVWFQQGVSNVDSFLRLFKERVKDIFIQGWSGAIRDRERYALYRTVKTLFEEESYLQDVNIYCFRVALTQFRFGVLPINGNLQRYNDCPSAKNCVFCKNITEDDSHFLLVCPMYSDLRNRFLTGLQSRNVNAMLRWKDKGRCQQLAQYLFHAVKRRQKHMSTLVL